MTSIEHKAKFRQKPNNEIALSVCFPLFLGKISVLFLFWYEMVYMRAVGTERPAGW